MNKNTFLANFPFGIIFHDSEGRIAEISKIGEEKLGLTLQEIKGKTWGDLPFILYKENGEVFPFEEHPVARTIKSGKETLDVTMGVFNRDKNITVWLKSCATIQQGDDKTDKVPTQVLFTFSDITDEIKAKKTLSNKIENANLGTWEWNIKTGETQFNERWAEIIGYTLEELSPINVDTWVKYIHPDDFKESNEILQAYFEGEISQYRFEARMRHKYGHWIWVLTIGKVIQWDAPKKPLLMSGMHLDITQQKQNELELHKKLELEKLLSEISSEFILTNDIDTSILQSFAKLATKTEASRIYVFLFDAGKETMSNTHEWCAKGVSVEKNNLQNLPLSLFPWWLEKLSKNEIIDIPDVSKMPPEAKQEQEILESQDITSVLVLPIISENKLSGFVGFDNVISGNLWSDQDTELLKLLTDILSNAVNRKVSEEGLRLLNKAVEDSPVSIMITDYDGTITYVNSEFEQITGYKIQEVLRKQPSLLNSGKQGKSFNSEIWETILAGKKWQGDLLNKKKNGDLFWATMSISPIKNNGKITHFVSVTQDISNTKNLIHELSEAKLKAEESDRLKSAFLANMSHEIRTPMNGILGFADLLKEADLTGEEQQEFITIIETSGTRMLNIINDIISISKIESGLMEVNIQESNINQQIEFIYTFFRPQVEAKGMSFLIKKTLSEKEAFIKTDAEKIYSILTNLVKNSIKYTEEGTIELGYRLKKSVESSELEFYIKDTGIGIHKDRHKAIFERFIQADIADKRAYQGAGLGLSISKAYAEMLGGKIWMESEEGKGSIFYLTLPYQTELEEKIIVENLDESDGIINPEISGLKVLIAEDDETNGMLISVIVKEHSMILLEASTGIEAVDLCRSHPDIDLILMDIQMSDLNGYEATRQIRQFNQDVIIIAQTAFGLTGDKEKSIEAGCNDYISKPFNKAKLLTVIGKYFKK